MNTKHIKVLLIEDNPGDARLIREMVKEASAAQFELAHLERLDEGLKRLDEEVFDVLLLDLSLSDSQGLDTFIRLQAQASVVPIIVLTGLSDETLGVKAVQQGAQDYLVKGQVDSNLLVRSMHYAMTRKQAEENLRRAAEEWRTTFDSISDLISIHDKDFKLLRVNKAFADFFKMEPRELIGKICYEVLHGTEVPQANCPHKKTLETGKPVTEEYFEPHLGVYLQVSTSPIFDDKGEAIGSVHIARDITEHKKNEEKLIVTDRLASVGELASGVAHELNNPLTSVIGFSQLLLEKSIPDEIREDVEIIHREAQRTAEVVKNLLTFAQKHEPSKQPVNINSIIAKVLKLRAYEQKASNIRVVTHLAPDLPQVTADDFQIQQVFLNIIINAEYFMTKAHNRGTLTVTTEKVDSLIRTSFANDGPGISKENLGHLFDPFFTTKEVGKGTGLGLSICHGIIAEHGGKIYAQSEPGQGATFIVELPITIDKKGTVK